MKILPFFTIVLVFCSCESSDSKKSGKTDLFSLGVEKNELAEIVDSVSFVDIKEHSDFLFSNIGKLIIKNNRIYIEGSSGVSSVLCFSMDGDFISKIGKLGQGPGEHNQFFDFDVDSTNIYICDRNKKKLMIYDLQGNLLEEKETPFRVEGFKMLPNQKILFSLQKDGEASDLLILAKNDLSVEKVLLKYGENTTEDLLAHNLFQTTGNAIFYNKPVNDSIYSFSKKGDLIHTYVFKDKKYNVPEDLKRSYSKLIENEEKKNTGHIYFFEVPFLINDKLIGYIFKGKHPATLILNPNTNEYAIKEWLPNKRSYRDIFPPVFSDGNYIVGWFDSEVYQFLKEKPPLTEKSLKHLKEGGRILCFYHFKK